MADSGERSGRWHSWSLWAAACSTCHSTSCVRCPGSDASYRCKSSGFVVCLFLIIRIFILKHFECNQVFGIPLFIVPGDFSIYIDNNMNSNAKDLFALLDPYGLSQHVNQPTHTRDHTLDLVITKGLDCYYVMVKHILILSVFFDLLITLGFQISSVSVKKRYINENTSAQFIEAICHQQGL